MIGFENREHGGDFAFAGSVTGPQEEARPLVSASKSLISMVGAHGLEPWTR